MYTCNFFTCLCSLEDLETEEPCFSDFSLAAYNMFALDYIFSAAFSTELLYITD